MRPTSNAFHCDTADRPASRASRKPSSVSPSGVLMAIPVTAMRLSLDKEDLHDAEGADPLASEHLARADRAVVIRADDSGDDIDGRTALDLADEHGVMYPHRANLPAWLRGKRLEQAES